MRQQTAGRRRAAGVNSRVLLTARLDHGSKQWLARFRRRLALAVAARWSASPTRTTPSRRDCRATDNRTSCSARSPEHLPRANPVRLRVLSMSGRYQAPCSVKSASPRGRCEPDNWSLAGLITNTKPHHLLVFARDPNAELRHHRQPFLIAFRFLIGDLSPKAVYAIQAPSVSAASSSWLLRWRRLGPGTSGPHDFRFGDRRLRVATDMRVFLGRASRNRTEAQPSLVRAAEQQQRL
jgi:hypothetical protein